MNYDIVLISYDILDLNFIPNYDFRNNTVRPKINKESSKKIIFETCAAYGKTKISPFRNRAIFRISFLYFVLHTIYYNARVYDIHQ